MSRRYARAYAAKYASTFDRPRKIDRTETEYIPYKGFDYGPKMWELLRLYSLRAWTDLTGREHFIIPTSRLEELGNAYAEYKASQQKDSASE